MISEHQADKLSPAAAVPQGFYAHLVLGLHAAAQPLTVLLASLSKEHTDALQAEELRELAAGSVIEVQRVCTLFHYLQQLLVAESIQPDMTRTSILSIVEHVARRTDLLFKQDQIDLRWVTPRTCPPLVIDRARTTHALSNVLLAAHAVSSKNDTIEVIVSRQGAHAVRILVTNRDASLDTVGIEPRLVELELSMAVAEANIRCQHGAFLWSLRPFLVDMRLKQATTPGTGK